MRVAFTPVGQGGSGTCLPGHEVIEFAGEASSGSTVSADRMAFPCPTNVREKRIEALEHVDVCP